MGEIGTVGDRKCRPKILAESGKAGGGDGVGASEKRVEGALPSWLLQDDRKQGITIKIKPNRITYMIRFYRNKTAQV